MGLFASQTKTCAVLSKSHLKPNVTTSEITIWLVLVDMVVSMRATLTDHWEFYRLNWFCLACSIFIRYRVDWLHRRRTGTDWIAIKTEYGRENALSIVKALRKKGEDPFTSILLEDSYITYELYLHLRFDGTDFGIMVRCQFQMNEWLDKVDFAQSFTT